MDAFYDTPRFTTEQVAAAAGVPAGTLAAQLRRGDIVLPAETVLQPGQGRARFFSLRRALHIALVQEMARAGVGVRRGASLADLFTGAPGDGGTPCRLHDGGTVFRVQHVAGGEPVGSVDRLADLPIPDMSPATLVNLDRLVARTTAALGISP